MSVGPAAGYSYRNNFDILRTAFAYMVVISHARFLSGSHIEYFPFNLSGLGVNGFFVISGFLMAWSLNRQPGLKPYAIKRFFRIYPLYFLIVTLQTVVFPLYASAGYPNLAAETLRYYAANLCFLNFLKPTIGDALSGLRIDAINGSLWTLKVEVAFYILVPVLLLLYKRLGGWCLVLAYVLSCAYVILLPSVRWTQQLPGQLRFFLVGVLLFYYGRRLELPAQRLLPIGVAGLVLSWVTMIAGIRGAGAAGVVLDPVFTGCLVYGVAFSKHVWKIEADLSYSTYVLHFPLIQLALLHHIPTQNFWLFLPFIVTVTTLLAWLSFRFVEQPFMKMGRMLASKLGEAAPLAVPVGSGV